MTDWTCETLIDNERVRVLRVTIAPGATYQPDTPREDRVIVPITVHGTERHARTRDGTADLEEGNIEILDRRPGEAVFRSASHHSIKNLSSTIQISVIIELK